MTETIEKTSIKLTGVAHRYPQADALERIDLVVGHGEVVGIVGPSGCGKSTLLSIVCGLSEPSRGSVEIGGSEESADRLPSCAYMPQRDLLLPWLKAIDNAGLAPRFAGVGRDLARRSAAEMFGRFGLEGFEDSLPGELSGGMRQRVALLRTLATDRPVLCLDEPFSALDAITRADLQSWLASILREEPRTCLLVTHDVEEAIYLCDRVLVLSGRPGRIVREITSPAPRSVDRAGEICSAEFVAAKQEALEALSTETTRP